MLLATGVAILTVGCGAAGGNEVLSTRELRIHGPRVAFDPEAWGEAVGAEVAALDQLIRFEWELEEANWDPLMQGTFRRALPLPARFRGDRRIRWELTGAMAYRDGSDSPKPKPGDFTASDYWLFICPPSLPIGTLRCVAYVPRGIVEDDGWHIANGRVAGRGLPVLPGETWTQELRIPEGMSLRFFSTASGVLGNKEDDARVRFRVSVDDLLLLDEERSTLGSADRWHTVELPATAPGKTSRLELSVAGDPSLTAFVAPRIAPTTPPVPSEGREHPDLVLFLADSFRADNLAVYGGDAETTPYLNKLAERTVLFERAWSNSCWTLPAQASMLTGTFPPRHGALDRDYMIPEDLQTLAEVLARAGYRCGAVTDSGFVSTTYNFNQGFEWFLEHPGWPSWDLAETIRRAEAFFDASDGRPNFLFVQTYRTHAPYRCGSDEDPLPLRSFQKERTQGLALDKALKELHSGPSVIATKPFYLDGATDLDSKLGPFWESLRSRPGERYLVFTSDHGEAFFDHENRGHHGIMYEELLRIPLLVDGPGLAPRRESRAASLVDLPRTLAAIAGVEPPPTWEGTNLLQLDEERPQFAFQREGGRYEVVAISEDKKLIGRGRWESVPLQHAFDLGDDPREKNNLLGRARWPRDLQTRLSPQVKTLLFDKDPGSPLADGALGETLRKQLADIGYTGD